MKFLYAQIWAIYEAQPRKALILDSDTLLNNWSIIEERIRTSRQILNNYTISKLWGLNNRSVLSHLPVMKLR